MLYDREYMQDGQANPWRSAAMWLIALNVGVFLLQCILAAFGYGHDFNRFFWLSPTALTHGHLWQLVTFQFCHYNANSGSIGLLHLLGNCLGIFWLGRSLELEIGGKRLLVLYLGAGVVGGLLQALMGIAIPSKFGVPTLGASAGVCGLLAAFAWRNPMQPISFLLMFVLPINLYARTLFWISFGVALFFVLIPAWPAVAHGAHLGGLIAGMLFVRFTDSEFQLPAFLKRAPERELVTTSVAHKKPGWKAAKAAREDLPPKDFISKEVDPILDKISAHGIHSLTPQERAILESARKKMQR